MKAVDKEEPEKVGRVPGDFLKRYNSLTSQDQANVDADDHTDGQVLSETVFGRTSDSSMLYVAIESYETKDTRQISLDEGMQVVVLEVCEDGELIQYNRGNVENYLTISFND